MNLTAHPRIFSLIFLWTWRAALCKYDSCYISGQQVHTVGLGTLKRECILLSVQYAHNITVHVLRFFFFFWLNRKDELTEPYSCCFHSGTVSRVVARPLFNIDVYIFTESFLVELLNFKIFIPSRLLRDKRSTNHSESFQCIWPLESNSSDAIMSLTKLCHWHWI